MWQQERSLARFGKCDRDDEYVVEWMIVVENEMQIFLDHESVVLDIAFLLRVIARFTQTQ